MTLVPAVGKLARVRWQMFLNGLRHASGREILKYLGIMVAVLVMAGVVFAVSFAMLSVLRHEEAAALFDVELLDQLPTLILGGVFVAVVIVSFQILLQALYLAGDMELLLSLPVPARAVFIVKFATAILPSLLLAGLLTLPVLWGLGASSGWNVLCYPLVLLPLVLQVVPAGGLSGLLVMAVVRVFPARRLFEVLSFLGATLGMLCAWSSNLGQAFAAGNGGLGPALAETAEALSGLTSPWLPLAWPGLGLVAIAHRRWLVGLGYLTVSAALAAAVVVVSLSAAERLYYSGWAKVHESPTRRVRRGDSRDAFTARRIPLLAPAVSGVVLKDWRTLRRDLRLLSPLIQSVIFGVIYVAVILYGGSDDEIVGFVQRYGLYVGVSVALFACCGIVNGLATGAFSREGTQYWVLKAAPVSAGQLMLAKWLVAFVPSLAIGSVLLIGTGLLHRVAVGDLLFGWLGIAFTLAGATGIDLAIGTANVKLDWTDPREIISGITGCITLLVGLGFLIVSVGLFLGPVLVMEVVNGPVVLGQLAGLVLGGGFCGAAAFLPPREVLGRVELIGEEGGV